MTERVSLTDRIDQILAHLEKIRHQLIMIKSEAPSDLVVGREGEPLHVIGQDGTVSTRD